MLIILSTAVKSLLIQVHTVWSDYTVIYRPYRVVYTHAVLLQEVNEVLQRVGGGEKPVPLWTSENTTAEPILYKLYFKLKVS